jgi:ATP-dependent helicase HrpA
LPGPTQYIRQIKQSLDRAMIADYYNIIRELKYIEQNKFKDETSFFKKINRLKRSVILSNKRYLARAQNIPPLQYPPQLPISSKRHEIIDSIKKHQVTIITGETGSGKTTQIPKMCLAAGCGRRGIIGLTQPRRIAAVSIAQRIAAECGEECGQSVAYKIRFEEKTSAEPLIKVMTDGILLAETVKDRDLLAYDTIIVDEAHERSLNIDFILGYLRTLLLKRKDLKVIITSATIDTAKFSGAYSEKNILLIWDQAGFHKAKDLLIPANITIAQLPPYSPELNPAERLWRWLRRHVCRNRLFKSLDEQADALAQAIKTLTAKQIASMCNCNYLLHDN